MTVSIVIACASDMVTCGLIIDAIGGEGILFLCRYVIKPHVSVLRFHTCKTKSYSKWRSMLNRDNFKVTSSTRVCSNHFFDGHPSESNPNPYLFMKGYDQCPTPKRRTINKHQLSKKKKLSPLQPISISCSDDHNYCSVDTTYETAEVQTEEFMIISSSEPN